MPDENLLEKSRRARRRQRKLRRPPVQAICAECAVRLGWKAIPGLQCTHWEGECDCCRRQRDCCAPGDYLDSKGRNMGAWD